MCGITGIFNFNLSDKISNNKIEGMTTLLQHRGPDNTSYFIENNIALGFTRLSIIDIENGNQPIKSKCGRYVLVFNGEIYNFKELRIKLLEQGVVFYTNSDSEVLLNLIIKYKDDFENKINGMFAFAFFDNAINQLLLVRDRFGKKPLFWTKTKTGIAFASEIKSLLKFKETNMPNYVNLSNFLSLGYCPGSETAFENIYQVEPGSGLILKNKIKSYTWWNNPSIPESKKTKSVNYEDLVLEKLKKSVEYRLRSDAPIGLFLSGGLDSTLILSLIKDLGIPKNFQTYTASFKSKSFDESKDAQFVANYFGVKNKKVLISPYDIPDIFEEVVYKSDNLIANPAIFPNFILSKVASQDIKVALNGGGGDELFFGYETFKADFLSEFFTFLPQGILNITKSTIKLLPTSHKKLNFKYKSLKFLDGISLDRLRRHYSWRVILSELDKEKLFPNFLKNYDAFSEYEKAYNEFEGDDIYEMFAYADMKVWWQCMGLYQGDSMSMANSLELRMPFMDYDLINTISKIPRHLKFKNGNLKMLYKNICSNYLPNKILNRPKSGFHVPFAEWFSNELKLFVLDKLSPQRLNCVKGLNQLYVREIIDNHLNMKEDNSFKICNLLILVEWYIKFIKQ